MSIDEYQLLKSKKGNLEVIPLQAEDAESGRPVALKSKDGTLAVSDVTLPVAFVTSILAGESLSGAVDFGSWNHLGLAPVSPWDSAVISLAVGMEEDGDFWPLVDTEGDEITITLTEGSAIGLPADVASALAPWRYVKFRSGTAASPIVQSGAEAAVTVTVAGEGEGAKKLTFTSGVGGVASNDLSVRIEVAEDDTLAADADGNEIIVKLANATANSNTAAHIEGVVRALAAVGEIDVSGMTVAANTAYTNAPVSGATVGEPAECVLDFGDDKTLTINSGVAGSVFNDLSVSVDNAADDNLDVNESDGVITISLALVTASKNSASAIESAIQALSVSGVDMTNFTVSESTEYAAARPAGVKASKIFTFDTGKTLTVASGVVGEESDAVSFEFEVAVDDNLAVSKDSNLVTVKLANATDSKNSAANIQTAVQNLATVGDIDVSAMTVTGSAGYNSAPVTGASVGDTAECELDFGDSKKLTINSGVAGSIYNDLSFEVEVAANDTLAVSEDAGVVTIKLANATATNNEASDIQTLVQGLSVSGVDMTHFTVTGSTEYDADEPDGTSLGDVAECELDFGNDRVLTVTPGFSGSIYNDLSFTVETAVDDNLDVNESEGVITISLANTTNTKNTAALIEAELQGLSVSGVNMLGFTVAESAEYIADRPAGAKASKIFETETDKTLTITSGVFGAESNAIKFTFGVNDDPTDHDELDVSESAGVITILLADTTPAKNAAANIKTAIQTLAKVAGVDVSAMTVVGNDAYNTTPSVALDSTFTAVALEGGRVAVEDGVIEEVPLTGGDDFVIDAVSMTGGDEFVVDGQLAGGAYPIVEGTIEEIPMEGGDEFVVDGQFSGGGNTFIRGILKR